MINLFYISLDPLLSTKVDNDWRKDFLKDINIFLSEKQSQEIDHLEFPSKMNLDKDRIWNDNGIQELITQIIEPKENESKEKKLPRNY